MFPKYTNPDHDIVPNGNIPNVLYQVPWVWAPGYTLQGGGSGIHHMASREKNVRDNVVVGIVVGGETCIRDKDMDPDWPLLW